VRYLLLILIITQCSPSHKKDDSNDDAYGEYDIAEPPKPEPQEYIIEIKQMKFQPEVLQANKGDKITWVNKDIVEHDVTELTLQSWASSKLQTGASWSLVVTKSEAYYCNLHVVMQGRIIVDGNDLTSLVEASMITVCQ